MLKYYLSTELTGYTEVTKGELLGTMNSGKLPFGYYERDHFGVITPELGGKLALKALQLDGSVLLWNPILLRHERVYNKHQISLHEMLSLISEYSTFTHTKDGILDAIIKFEGANKVVVLLIESMVRDAGLASEVVYYAGKEGATYVDITYDFAKKSIKIVYKYDG